MPRSTRLKFDRIGYWSEIKLEIVRKYAAAYSRILSAQDRPRLRHVYIDAFSGAGVHISRTTGEFVPGSPLNALRIDPPFTEYYFIDLDSKKTSLLKKLVGHRVDVHVLEGNCNKLMLDEIFPHVRYEDYRRALCLLDPYGLHLNWKVIQTAGKMRSVDMFLNFPVADMNRNVLWRNPQGVRGEDIQRMSAFWGDESWRNAAYGTEDEDLFGYRRSRKEDNEVIAECFCDRLKKVAGFSYVSAPLPMRNSRGATIYFLAFASQKVVATHIVDEIFSTYRDRGSH